MAKFDAKSFNAEAFGRYVRSIPNARKSELARSEAVGTNENARSALSAQGGSLYARVPYFGRISGATSQNNDGATDIASTATTTFEQGFVVASRMDAWTERSFAKNITAGTDFMDQVGAQISDYKQEVRQSMLLAMLKGVFSMKTTGTDSAAKAAKEFVEKHTFDISGESGEAARVGADTLNRAIQRACGDQKSLFSLVIMHSEVATNLENVQLLKYLTYTDKDGITRDLAIASWNGRTVLIDDGMPVEEVAASGSGASVVPAHTVYTTYVLGKGAIVLDDIGDAVPYEMSRDAKTNGGQDTLYVRDRYICGVDGISFEKPASLTASASNADLASGDNWRIVHDGTVAVPHKTIAIARILSQG